MSWYTISMTVINSVNFTKFFENIAIHVLFSLKSESLIFNFCAETVVNKIYFWAQVSVLTTVRNHLSTLKQVNKMNKVLC